MTFDLPAALSAAPVIVVLRGETPSRTVELCERAWELGVRAVEVTIQDPSALPALEAAVAAGRRLGHEVGAGSVHTAAQWHAARTAGAAFTVAAATVPEVIALAAAHDIAHVPGVATATEVATALAAGATLLKAFPAALLTPAWVRAVRAPFPAATFVATGGISAGNAQAFLDAGCRAVGFGSSFAEPDSAAEVRRLIAHASQTHIESID